MVGKDEAFAAEMDFGKKAILAIESEPVARAPRGVLSDLLDDRYPGDEVGGGKRKEAQPVGTRAVDRIAKSQRGELKDDFVKIVRPVVHARNTSGQGLIKIKIKS